MAFNEIELRDQWGAVLMDLILMVGVLGLVGFGAYKIFGPAIERRRYS